MPFLDETHGSEVHDALKQFENSNWTFSYIMPGQIKFMTISIISSLISSSHESSSVHEVSLISGLSKRVEISDNIIVAR